MSRIAKEAVVIPAGVEAKLNGQEVSVKGKNGSLTRTVSSWSRLPLMTASSILLPLMTLQPQMISPAPRGHWSIQWLPAFMTAIPAS